MNKISGEASLKMAKSSLFCLQNGASFGKSQLLNGANFGKSKQKQKGAKIQISWNKRSSLRSQCCKMRLFGWFSNSLDICIIIAQLLCIPDAFSLKNVRSLLTIGRLFHHLAYCAFTMHDWIFNNSLCYVVWKREFYEKDWKVHFFLGRSKKPQAYEKISKLIFLFSSINLWRDEF